VLNPILNSMKKYIVNLSEKANKLVRTLMEPNSWKLIRHEIDPDVYHLFNTPWFLNSNISTVIDIGANTGQFALLANQMLPEAHIYSFEPLVECFQKLLNQTSDISNIHAFNFALGDKNEQKEFYSNSFSQASSFLQTTSCNDENYPLASDHRPVGLMEIRTLDSLTDIITITDNLMIKIDVQGYEDKVISGGENTFKKASTILIETGFVELYQESPLFDDIYKKLMSLGFEFNGFIGQSRDKNGKMIWGDALFFRT
jgi:FkbM family methyltransferase